MKNPALSLTFATAFLSAPLLATAQPPGPPPQGVAPRPAPRMNQDARRGETGPEGGPMMMRRRAAVAELGLTETQKEDIRKSREATRRDRVRKVADLRIASMDLKSLLRAEKVDEKAVAAKLAEVQAAQGALLKLRVDSALAMKRILTPEQQKKLSEMRGRAGERRLMRRGTGNRGLAGRAMKPRGPGDDPDSDADLDDFDLDFEANPGIVR